MTAFKLSRPEPSESTVLAFVLRALQYDRRVGKVWRMNTGGAWARCGA